MFKRRQQSDELEEHLEYFIKFVIRTVKCHENARNWKSHLNISFTLNWWEQTVCFISKRRGVFLLSSLSSMANECACGMWMRCPFVVITFMCISAYRTFSVTHLATIENVLNFFITIRQVWSQKMIHDSVAYFVAVCLCSSLFSTHFFSILRLSRVIFEVLDIYNLTNEKWKHKLLFDFFLSFSD